MENTKRNGAHKFVLNLSQKLDLRSLNKYVTLQNLSIYYTWKNIRKQYKNNKLEIMISLNYELVLILCQTLYRINCYIRYIMKEYATLTTISPICIYINRIKIDSNKI